MPNFSYKAIDKDKAVSEGTVAAKTRDEVAQILSRKGLAPLVIKAVTERTTVHGTVPVVDKITFCRYLGAMLATGLSLSEGIDVLRRETKNPMMRRVLGDMSYGLEQGQQLSTVFERFPDVFEPYFLALIRAGEISGKLAEVFRYLESEMRSEYSLNSKVKGALVYPAIVFSAMVGIGTLMFFFVLPQIGKVFLSLNLPLPGLTKLMFTVSIALSTQMIPILGGAIGSVILLFFGMKNKKVKTLMYRAIQPFPLVKTLIKKADLARFNRIFSTLIRSAVPITDALEISLKSLAWPEYRSMAEVFPTEIRKGKSLSQVVRERNIFPSLMVQMIAAGEKTATLDSTLADLAVFYEQEVEEEVKSLTQIIEPVMMLLVGIAVGAMILSIIAPIYSVVGSFQQAAGGKIQ